MRPIKTITSLLPWNIQAVMKAKVKRAGHSNYVIPFDYWREENMLHAEGIKTVMQKMLELPNEEAFRAFTAEFEIEFARAYKSPAALGVGSGTAALVFSLLSLNIGKGDEVIAPVHTYISSILAILDTGATPVLVDVKRDLTIDPEKTASVITKRTKAIMPVHIYGIPCDMHAIMEIANKYHVRVVEDACQGHATKINGRPAGTFGDFGCFSFHYSKQIGAPGDGGMVICREQKDADHIACLREPIYMDPRVLVSRRTPSRLSPALIPFLLVKLRNLRQDVSMRKKLAAWYTKELADIRQVEQLPNPPAGSEHGWRNYTIRVWERKTFQDYLRGKRIETKILYPFPLHLRPELKLLNYKPGDFPIYEIAQKEIVSLPFSHALPWENAQKIVQTISQFYKLHE